MQIFSTMVFIIKYCLWGSLLGLLLLFFMPQSKLPFNWQSAQNAWQFYQSQASVRDYKLADKLLSIEDLSFADAVEKASPSVVSINVYRPKGLRKSDQLGPNEKILDVAVGIGSGVILHRQGYIVTNYHVIADADRISINFPDGRRRFVEVVGFDEKTDIAVLKTDLQGLISAELATSNNVKTGDIVMAMGSPFALDPSVSLGIVSAVTFNPFPPRIQTDAAINSGNSGGALINSRGEVIGINQSQLSSRGGGQTGINYAIPIDRVKRIAEDIILHGRVRRNWFGVNVANLTEFGYRQLFPDLQVGQGVYINDIEAGSPADKAGMLKEDLIMSFDGHKVSGLASFYELFYNTKIGKKVDIELIRDNKLIKVSIQLLEQSE